MPLIIKWPSHLKLSPRRVTKLGSVMDIVPTVARVLKLPFSDAAWSQFEGHNLAAGKGPEIVVSHRSNSAGPGGHVALVDERWKYVVDKGDVEMLFDLINDPIEQHDVAESNPTVVATLRKRLQDYQSQERKLRTHTAFLRLDVDQDALRALGYIDETSEEDRRD